MKAGNWKGALVDCLRLFRWNAGFWMPNQEFLERGWVIEEKAGSPVPLPARISQGGEKRRFESLFQRMLRKAVATPGDVRARENRAGGGDGEDATSPGAGARIEAGGDDFERRPFSSFETEMVELLSFVGGERRQIAGRPVIRKKRREGGE